MREKIEEVLESEVRPILQRDGGDIELVEVNENEGVVMVRLEGACSHCPMSQMTSLFLVEKVLKDKMPEIKKVITV